MNQQNDNHGFTNIFYKGKPVEPDLSAKSDFVVVARNKVHKWWLVHVRHIPSDKVWLISAFKGSFDLKVKLEESMPKSEGRVVSVTAPPVYDPDVKRTGGRMVRRMPKQLKKIKDAQEHEAL